MKKSKFDILYESIMSESAESALNLPENLMEDLQLFVKEYPKTNINDFSFFNVVFDSFPNISYRFPDFGSEPSEFPLSLIFEITDDVFLTFYFGFNTSQELYYWIRFRDDINKNYKNFDIIMALNINKLENVITEIKSMLIEK